MEFYFWKNLSFEIFEVRRKEFKQRREENSADSASIIEAFVKKKIKTKSTAITVLNLISLKSTFCNKSCYSLGAFILL